MGLERENGREGRDGKEKERWEVEEERMEGKDGGGI